MKVGVMLLMHMVCISYVLAVLRILLGKIVSMLRIFTRKESVPLLRLR